MKNVKVIGVILTFAVLAMFSCVVEIEQIYERSGSLDNDNPTVSVKATYDGQTVTVANEGEIQAPQGTMVDLYITCTMGANSLRNVKLLSKLENRTQQYTVVHSVLLEKDAGKPVIFRYITSFGAADEVLTVQAIDSKDRVTEMNLTLKTIVVVPPVPDPGVNWVFMKYPAVSLGGQTHTTLPSFYSVSQLKVYLLSAARTNPGIIDFAYWYSGGGIIYSPSQAKTDALRYSNANSALNPANWTTTNATKFYKITATVPNDLNAAGSTEWKAAFDAAATALNATTAPASVVYKTEVLQQNSVYAFKTAGNIIGAFVVTSVGTAANGTISFEIIKATARTPEFPVEV